MLFRSPDTVASRLSIKEPTTLNLNAMIKTPDNMGNNRSNFTALTVDADTTINADANGRLAAQFGKAGDSFPKVAVKPIADGLYEVDAPALTEALQSGRYDYRTLIESPLYPDQMVFLIGTLFENKPELAEGEASVEFRTGRVLLRMKEKNAQVVAETLTAVTFIMDTIR